MAYNDEFGYHEVIHTAHIMAVDWETHILGHGVVNQDEPELQELAEKIGSLIGDFYQMVCNKSDEKFNKWG
jgi:hypothetical protein